MEPVQRVAAPSQIEEPGMRFALEFSWFVSNALIAEGVHALWWFGTIWPRSAAKGEAIEGILIMAIICVPVAFILLYPLLRLALRPAHSRSPFFAALTGPWLCGVVIAVALLLGGERLGGLFARLFG
jgi:hypothetical protein